MATLRLVPASGAPLEVKGDSALVGREPTCDIVVSDGSVSRKHARIERRGAGFLVLDQGSANGTFLDSQRVAESALRSGQELRFGAVSFRVEIEEDDISATVVATPSPDATVVATPGVMPTPPLGVPVAAPPPLPKAAPPPVQRPAAPPSPPPRAAAPPPPLPPSAAASRERFGGRPQAAPSAPVGQMPAPPAVGKKGRSPMFWMVTGCCGCLVVGVLVVGGIVGAGFLATQAPASAVHSELAELRRGDLDAAYRRLSPELQAQLPPREFEQLVREHPGLGENKDATFWSRSVQNERARLSGVLTTRSGDVERATFELVKEGGEWRITSIRLGSDASE
jgi:pSer/pThr/pTyr-binding forkhead associated (FHA) protein